jgi:hyperosmotically inducible periplasmic protein
VLRRLFALIVLVGLVGAAWYVWSGRSVRPATGEALAKGLDGATGRLGQVGTQIQDTKVTASVKTALGLNRNLEAHDIDVSTRSGIVTLAGRVGREDQKRAALEIAAAVPDVQQVVDQLRVDASSAAAPTDGRTVGEALDDRALEAKINLAYSLNRNLQGSNLDVRAFRRAVTLGGDVSTSDQRQLAVSIAQQAPNVSGVSDQIRVGGLSAPEVPTAPAADNAATAPGAPAGAAQPTPAGATGAASGDAAAAAERAIAGNPNLAGYGLDARLENNRLVLSGRVRTGAEKDLAGVLAREAAGLPTDNAVEVRP